VTIEKIVRTARNRSLAPKDFMPSGSLSRGTDSIFGLGLPNLSAVRISGFVCNPLLLM
jgi:hypothetical protein